MRVLRRYWFTFTKFTNPTVLNLGCGVTAYDVDDAMNLLRNHFFEGKVPEVVHFEEDVDISALDHKHVLPNMGSPIVRGVWFPLGVDRTRT